ncbi:phage tail assembly chaperone [Leisingera sp. S132]|uniref:rcc01693 family protein n=1 Tax=Leisingera sp. S132 TaxID=2867016 RepID=UPI0021A86EC4|nr:rcc01693 family protein [Leisingera sp. S132]UWQ81135.1 phage tail assembly chaperone [Leisingera sp. S132]
MSALDWPALMRAGMAGLKLLPRDFWQLTPAELRLMLGDPVSPQPLGRDRLSALMAAFPDTAGAKNKETTDD